MASGSGLSSSEVELALAMEGQAVAARGSGRQRRAWRRSASSRADEESSGGELLGFGAHFFLFPIIAEQKRAVAGAILARGAAAAGAWRPWWVRAGPWRRRPRGCLDAALELPHGRIRAGRGVSSLPASASLSGHGGSGGGGTRPPHPGRPPFPAASTAPPRPSSGLPRPLPRTRSTRPRAQRGHGRRRRARGGGIRASASGLPFSPSSPSPSISLSPAAVRSGSGEP